MSTPLRKVLPTECRPLLVGYRTTTSDCYDDDDSADQKNYRHTPHKNRGVPILPPLSSTPPSSSSKNQSTPTPSTDWLNVARHTLLDVTRSLPVARNTEIRLKTTADAITKIELARQQSEQPSLHHQQYRLPTGSTPIKSRNNNNNNNVEDTTNNNFAAQRRMFLNPAADGDDVVVNEDNLSSDFYSGGKDQSVYDEAVRVRNTLEIVATRIRDAIAQDVKNKIYKQHQEEYFRQKEKKLQEEQAEKIDSLSSELEQLRNENCSLAQQLENADLLRRSMLQNEKSQRESDIRAHVRNSQFASRLQRNIFHVENEELELRNDIQLSCLEELLFCVLEQQQRITAASAGSLQRNVVDQEESEQNTKNLLDAQREEMENENFKNRFTQLEEFERETRQLVESLCDANFEFFSTFYSEETEIVIERIERQEAEANKDSMTRSNNDDMEEERKKWIQHSNNTINEIFDHHLVRELENDFEPSSRKLILGWENDQRDAIFISFFGSEQNRIQENEQARKELEAKTFWTKYFQIWKCWTLMKREENLRLDRERHNRIVDSALFLQKSQLDSAMDTLVIHHFNNNDVDDEHQRYFSSTSSFMKYYNNNNQQKVTKSNNNDDDDDNNKSPSVWNHHHHHPSNTSTGRSYDDNSNNNDLMARQQQHPAYLSTSRRTTPNRNMFASSSSLKTNNNTASSKFWNSNRQNDEGSVSP